MTARPREMRKLTLAGVLQSDRSRDSARPIVDQLSCWSTYLLENLEYAGWLSQKTKCTLQRDLPKLSIDCQTVPFHSELRVATFVAGTYKSIKWCSNFSLCRCPTSRTLQYTPSSS